MSILFWEFLTTLQVFAAHAYKSDTANLFDSSKPGVKTNKKIAASNKEVADNPAYPSTATSDKEEESISMEMMVATKEYQDGDRSSRTAPSTNTEGSRQSGDELADQLMYEYCNKHAPSILLIFHNLQK